ncbi:MAG: antibiotic biosynthesis monooxygenase [Anaerolineales bacterium]|nr:antibiotic biosynthesis monooxygenase [Anaerolineales bacterium]
MPIVLIDIYTMPDEAAATFVERARPIQTLLKTLPGFIEGHLHECMAGDSPFRFVSTAVWADEAALDNARNAVSAENRRLGLDPQAQLRAHGIERRRALYRRIGY